MKLYLPSNPFTVVRALRYPNSVVTPAWYAPTTLLAMHRTGIPGAAALATFAQLSEAVKRGRGSVLSVLLDPEPVFHTAHSADYSVTHTLYAFDPGALPMTLANRRLVTAWQEGMESRKGLAENPRDLCAENAHRLRLPETKVRDHVARRASAGSFPLLASETAKLRVSYLAGILASADYETAWTTALEINASAYADEGTRQLAAAHGFVTKNLRLLSAI